MGKKKWTWIYQDIEDVSRNTIFLENYIHSSTDTFELGREAVLGDLDEETVKENFKLRILEIVKKELIYYRSLEKEYLAQVNSKRKGSKPLFKSAKELSEEFGNIYRLALENTVILNHIEIKKAKIELKSKWDEGELSRKELNKKELSEEYKKYKEEQYELLETNIKAISSILKDVFNDFELVFKDKELLTKEESRLQNYKKVWLPVIKSHLEIKPPSRDITIEDLKDFSISGFLNSMKDKQKNALWTSLITKSGAPYGHVFESEFIKLTSSKIFEDFIDTTLGSKRGVGDKFVRKNVVDVLLSEVSLSKGGSVNIGASLKMRADDIISGSYNMTSADYIDKKYRMIPKKTREQMLYLRRNYSALTKDNSFRLFEADLSLLFGITRFLNEFIDKLKNKKKDYKIFTMFIISRDEVYLVSDILDNILKQFEKTRDLNKVRGLETKPKEWTPAIKSSDMNELLKIKKDFLSNADKIGGSFYKKALRDKKIRELLNALNAQLSLNPVKKAFYKLDLKSFYGKK